MATMHEVSWAAEAPCQRSARSRWRVPTPAARPTATPPAASCGGWSGGDGSQECNAGWAVHAGVAAGAAHLQAARQAHTALPHSVPTPPPPHLRAAPSAAHLCDFCGQQRQHLERRGGVPLVAASAAAGVWQLLGQAVE